MSSVSDCTTPALLDQGRHHWTGEAVGSPLWSRCSEYVEPEMHIDWHTNMFNHGPCSVPHISYNLYYVPCTSTMHHAPCTMHMVHGTWCMVHGRCMWYMVNGIWCKLFGTWMWHVVHEVVHGCTKTDLINKSKNKKGLSMMSKKPGSSIGALDPSESKHQSQSCLVECTLKPNHLSERPHWEL